MNKNIRNSGFYFLTCLSTLAYSFETHILTDNLYGTSFFTPRSQTTDAARDLVGWHRFTHLCEDNFYGTGAITLEYTRSFRSRRLAEYFFGTDILHVSGSFTGNRAADHFLADYFGLSPDFSSVVLVKPRLQNLIADLAAFVGYHNWYFTIHAPFVRTTTRMLLDEAIDDNGFATPYPAGYMSVDELQAPYTSFAQAMQGTKDFGDVERLKFGKISGCDLSLNGISDILMTLGYDLVNRDTNYAGFNLRLAIPTGNRPTSEFLFEPIVGNGKHWELGLGFSGKVLIWEKDGDQTTHFFVDLNAMHLFWTRQHRSFDFFLNGFGSRYILLKEFDETGTYTGNTVPAINITTLPCDVSNAVQCDVVFMFGYEYNNFNFDIGYNGWVRSTEKICLCVDPFEQRRWAFKGIQNVENFDGTTDSTQSNATLIGNNFDEQALVADPNPPVFIAPGSLDLLSAASPLQFTNAIFWNFSYAWCPRNPMGIEPFLGGGGKVEFEGIRPKEVLPNKNSLSQWAIWLKGGLAW